MLDKDRNKNRRVVYLALKAHGEWFVHSHLECFNNFLFRQFTIIRPYFNTLSIVTAFFYINIYFILYRYKYLDLLLKCSQLDPITYEIVFLVGPTYKLPYKRVTRT